MPAWSRCLSKTGKRREKTWNERFNVMWSKDNERFHKAEREYFDRKKEWEAQIPQKRVIRSMASKRSLQEGWAVRGKSEEPMA